ncbi:Hypothetical Protein RSKD131_4216 [Cereibacter sphaeroides KD131]|nr:Hypothetical Protein RSKD131_4216 [Cereibacter sphaeroides KD131]
MHDGPPRCAGISYTRPLLTTSGPRERNTRHTPRRGVIRQERDQRSDLAATGPRGRS